MENVVASCVELLFLMTARMSLHTEAGDRSVQCQRIERITAVPQIRARLVRYALAADNSYMFRANTERCNRNVYRITIFFLSQILISVSDGTAGKRS